APAPRPWPMALSGALVGGFVGATSAGSGTLGTSLLSLLTRMDARRLVGTVTVHALVVTGAAALVHLAAGGVRLDLAGALLLGSLPGVALGARLAVRVPEPALRA